MNLTITAPPKPSGTASEDTKNLYKWCSGLYSNLKRVFFTIDDMNITALDGGKLYGEIDLSKTALKGLNVNLNGDGFSLVTPDGAQYLKLENGSLTFCGTVKEPEV